MMDVKVSKHKYISRWVDGEKLLKIYLENLSYMKDHQKPCSNK